ncbi:MAG: helix-turn-helix domain-containing protein [Prevotella sp.]|nr:helix-turn-helix domain-containing protein [Prevotella sp.]
MKENNLGTLIKEVANKKAISPNKLAESIGCTVGNIYKYFRKNNMDIQLLARIGKVLEHDFFYDISKKKGCLIIVKTMKMLLITWKKALIISPR